MGERLFIADLHLSAERSSTVDLFLRFLRERAALADELYILGDFFDSWIGDDDNRPPIPEVRKALRRLTDTGRQIFVQHGNRDFLLGKRFAKQTGVQLLGEEYCIALDTGKVLLMHGDLLCSDDLEYLRARKKLRNPVFMWLMSAMPLGFRIRLAADFRQRSRKVTAKKTDQIMDVSPDTVNVYLQKHRATTLIHGHTHRPTIHHIDLGGRSTQRFVLGEWHKDSARILSLNSGIFNLETFS